MKHFLPFVVFDCFLMVLFLALINLISTSVSAGLLRIMNMQIIQRLEVPRLANIKQELLVKIHHDGDPQELI